MTPKPIPETVVHVATGNPVAAKRQQDWLRRIWSPAPKQPTPKKAG